MEMHCCHNRKKNQDRYSYQEVTVAAKADAGAAHPLQVDVGALGFDIAEASLQGALLGEQVFQTGWGRGSTPVSSPLAPLANNNNKQDLSINGLVFVYLNKDSPIGKDFYLGGSTQKPTRHDNVHSGVKLF